MVTGSKEFYFKLELTPGNKTYGHRIVCRVTDFFVFVVFNFFV